MKVTPALLVMLSIPALRANAQFRLEHDSTRWAPVSAIGSADDDRLRLEQLWGRAPASGWMMRTASSSALAARRGFEASIARPSACPVRWSLVRPRLELVSNSAIPYERNDAGVWSGRGRTISGMAGARAVCGPVRVQVVPRFWYAENRPFALVGVEVPGQSGYSNPFFSGRGWSADAPVRFGNQSLLVFEPGETSVEADVRYVTVGVGTESQWWGPGIRNALVMSNNASGIPGAYVRTAAPWRTPVGDFEARWMVGALTESRYFNTDPTDNLRSLSGLVMTLRPSVDTTFTFGFARVVFAPIGSATALPARFLDAVARWGPSGDVRQATFGRGADQLAALFGRWVLPESGFEAYAEWARVLLPRSLRSLLVDPEQSQGYTLGVQWVSAPPDSASSWRVQAEVSDLEQSLTTRTVVPPTFYVSPTVPQGYTQRGQVIGALIGPGSSSQFAAVDRLMSIARVGAFIERIRWTNDAFFLAPTGLSVWAHDVSLRAGLRGSYATGPVDVGLELVAENRLNYLFQSATVGFNEDRTFDVRNVSFRVTLEPRAGQRSR